VAELLLDHRQPVERLLRRADAARGLEPDEVAGPLAVLADLAGHHQAERQGGVDALLAGRSLDEVGARHHGDEARPRHLPERAELAGGEDRLEVGGPRRGAERLYLVVEREPVAGERVRAGYDDVDLPPPR